MISMKRSKKRLKNWHNDVSSHFTLSKSKKLEKFINQQDVKIFTCKLCHKKIQGNEIEHWAVDHYMEKLNDTFVEIDSDRVYKIAKRLKCKNCDKVFVQPQYFKNTHVKFCGKEINLITCQYCNKAIKATSMAYHIRYHHRDKCVTTLNEFEPYVTSPANPFKLKHCKILKKEDYRDKKDFKHGSKIIMKNELEQLSVLTPLKLINNTIDEIQSVDKHRNIKIAKILSPIKTKAFLLKRSEQSVSDYPASMLKKDDSIKNESKHNNNLTVDNKLNSLSVLTSLKLINSTIDQIESGDKHKNFEILKKVKQVNSNTSLTCNESDNSNKKVQSTSQEPPLSLISELNKLGSQIEPKGSIDIVQVKIETDPVKLQPTTDNSISTQEDCKYLSVDPFSNNDNNITNSFHNPNFHQEIDLSKIFNENVYTTIESVIEKIKSNVTMHIKKLHQEINTLKIENNRLVLKNNSLQSKISDNILL
ncbi:hypothetical protein A3Q56_04301 [Intoshia linei]|uniref:Uncharacterized protein n=1 Tax=Intoshia linei TaxID=1819745 RepID=A0A177B2J7_9BILA|nr:hypothetical protein A3Q56_04301 [Intoshia linei]